MFTAGRIRLCGSIFAGKDEFFYPSLGDLLFRDLVALLGLTNPKLIDQFVGQTLFRSVYLCSFTTLFGLVFYLFLWKTVCWFV